MVKSNISKAGRILLKILGWVFAFVFGLLLLLLIILQFPQTQRFITGKAVTFLENKLQTKVQVGGINVAFPKSIWLQDLYLETPQQDTLLYLHSLQVDVDFFALMDQEIQVNDVEMDGLKGKITRTLPDSTFNFDFIIEAFASDTSAAPQDTTSSPWKFSAYGLEIENTQFGYNDEVSGIDFQINIGAFDLELDEFNLDSMRFYAGNFTLSNTTANLVQTSISPSEEEDTTSSAPIDLDIGLDEMDLENLSFAFSNADILLDVQLGHSYIASELINLAGQIVNLQEFDLQDTEIKVALRTQDTTAVDAPPPTEASGEISWGSGWHVRSDGLTMSNNRFQFDNHTEPKIPQSMDFNHLALSGMKMDLKNVVYNDDTLQGNIQEIAVKDTSGFHLQKLSGNFSLNQQKALLEDLVVQTNNSQINANLETSFPSLQAVMDNPALLQLQLDMQNMQVGLGDLLYFQPDILNTIPLKINEGFQVQAAGSINGHFDDLRVSNLEMTALTHTAVQMHGNIKGLPDINQSQFDIDLSRFTTSRKDIQSIIPDTLLPQQLQLPENITVSAQLAGTAKDYQGKINIESSFGKLAVDWQSKGDTAFIPDTYQATLEIQRFHAGKLLNNEDTIGLLDMEAQLEGTGLSPNTMQARLQATIHRFEYQQYPYKNIQIEGNADHQRYAAQISLEDENLTFDLDGSIDMNQQTPRYQLALQIENAFLKPLNLTQDELKLKASLDVDIQMDSLENINGDAGLRDVAIFKNDTLYAVDSLLIASVNQEGKTDIRVDADFLSARFNGTFGLTSLPKVLEQHLNTYYHLHDTALVTNLPAQQFEFEIDLKSTELITDVLVPEIETFQPGKITGNYNSDQKLLELNFQIPQITYANNVVDSLSFTANSDTSALTYSLEIDQLSGGPANIHNLSLTGKVADNQINTNLILQDDEGKSKYNIPVRFSSQENNYRFHFLSDSLIFYYENWRLPEDHYLSFGNDGFVANNFILQNKEQELQLETASDEGNLLLRFKNLGLKMLSGMASQDTLLMGGKLNGTFSTQNQEGVFAFTSDLDIQNFNFLEDTVGNLEVHANNQAENNTYQVEVSLSGKGNHVNIAGNYLADSTDNNLDFEIDFNPLSLATAESFSAGQLSEARGFLSGTLSVEGTLTQPAINGELTFNNTNFNVTYLNTPFSVDGETIRMNDNTIVFNQFTLNDKNNNKAVVDGSARTEDFSVFAFDLQVSTSNFMLLNTGVEDNDLYYGELRADIDLDLSGDSNTPKVNLTLQIAEESNLTYVVPESDAGVVERQEIVRFIDMDQTDDPFFEAIETADTKEMSTSTFTGIELAANIDINSESVLNVVIDPIAGDQLTVRGDATLSLGMNPAGDVTLTGRYEVSEGSYNLSFYQFVKRKFTVQTGSNLQWTGDPANPVLDLTAIHTVETSPLELVRNQVTDNVNQYRQELPFQVQLNLDGTLLKPEISFGLDMPLEERQAMQGVPYSKLQVINTRESELNKQVFSLLVLQRFMAENPFASPGSSVEATARSSVSKILTSQLNQLANQIGEVNITVDLKSYEDYTNGGAEGQTDLEVGLSQQFFDDRLSVQLGGNVNLEGKTRQQSLSDYAGDIIIEYKLTEDGRFRLTAFRKEVYEELRAGETIETGVGVIFVKDYDKLRNIFKKVSEDISNLNDSTVKK